MLKCCTNYLVENLLAANQEGEQQPQQNRQISPQSNYHDQQQQPQIRQRPEEEAPIPSNSSAAAVSVNGDGDIVDDFDDDDDEESVMSGGAVTKKHVNYDLYFEFNLKLFCSSSSFTWNDKTPVIFSVSPNVFLNYHHFTQSSILRNTNEVLRLWHGEIFSPIIKEYESYLNEQMKKYPAHVRDTITFSNNIVYLNKKEWKVA